MTKATKTATAVSLIAERGFVSDVDLAQAIECKPRNVRDLLWKLVQRGELTRLGRRDEEGKSVLGYVRGPKFRPEIYKVEIGAPADPDARASAVAVLDAWLARCYVCRPRGERKAA